MRRSILLAALLAGSASCGGDHSPGRTFLLLTIDTLRADRLGAYGCPRGTSPALDRLAARSVLLTDCASVSSWTMPAMGTLATGLRPNEHGMVYWHLPLGDVEDTLSEALGRGGVATAFFGNPIPRLEGLDRGFDVWRTFEGDDGTAVAAAVDWLRDTGGDRFLWVHLLTPHAPYDPQPGTARPDPALDPRTVLYDAEVRTVDRLAQALLAAVGDSAAVVMTSDHGETLDERAELEYDHGKYLFEELVRVPCAVRIPGAAPRTARDRTTLLDLPVTICDWFDLPAPRGADGASLLPLVRGEAAEDRGPTFAWVVEDEPPRRKDRRWSVRVGDRKAVFNVTRGSARLFDLAADPGETRDLAPARPEALQPLRRQLEEWRGVVPEPEIPFEQRFTSAELERLQALGYLGGAD